jgi:phospho-N-acetylmuramoyl-pentapeptide-transferase
MTSVIGNFSDAAAGFIPAMAITLAVGKPAIRGLQNLGAKQTVSENAPQQHVVKQGTPTMGGLFLVAGMLCPILAVASTREGGMQVAGVAGLTAVFCAIGFVDDLLIARRGKNLGLTARQKLAMQFAAAILFAIWLKMTATPARTTWISIMDSRFDLGTAYYALAVLFIVGFSNAVNFADGLDGLAAGLCTALALYLIAAGSHAGPALAIQVAAGAVAGACGGFLWFNCHPAQVFMGDTGSLALGAALSGLAIVSKVEAPFQIAGGLIWAILFSVIIQVTVFKLRRRSRGLEYAKAHRVFRRTPLHHHFEELGWKETAVVQRFWLIGAMCTAIALLI